MTKQTHGWQRAKEKLPPAGEWVLVCDYHNGLSMNVAYYDSSAYGGGVGGFMLADPKLDPMPVAAEWWKDLPAWPDDGQEHKEVEE